MLTRPPECAARACNANIDVPRQVAQHDVQAYEGTWVRCIFSDILVCHRQYAMGSDLCLNKRSRAERAELVERSAQPQRCGQQYDTARLLESNAHRRTRGSTRPSLGATCNMQHATYKPQHATCNMQHTPCSVQRRPADYTARVQSRAVQRSRFDSDQTQYAQWPTYSTVATTYSLVG